MTILKAHATVDIDAPRNKVWEIMLDMPNYKEWNPFIVGVQNAPATLSVGDTFILNVRWADGGEVRSPERVTRIQAPKDDHTLAEFEYRYDHLLHRLAMIRATRVQTLRTLEGRHSL